MADYFMIRFGGCLSIKSLLPAAAWVFFVFLLSTASCFEKNKKSPALRAKGFVEVGGGFEPP
jgi:hypothetical protein